jgi:hypothetical protein
LIRTPNKIVFLKYFRKGICGVFISIVGMPNLGLVGKKQKNIREKD